MIPDIQKQEVIIRTNFDDWTEVAVCTEYNGMSELHTIYEGHDLPSVWMKTLLNKLGVAYRVVEVDFEAEMEEAVETNRVMASEL